MRFDPDAKNYVFSTEQEITITEEAEIRHQLLSNVFKPVSSGNMSPLKLGLAISIFIGFVAAIIYTASKGKIGLCISIFGSMFLLAGFSLFFTKSPEAYTFDRNSLKPKQNAAFVTMLGALMTFAPLLIKYFSREDSKVSTGNVLVTLFGAVFALAGGFFLISVINGIVKSSKGYGYETEGECIGYVRGFRSDHEDNRSYIVSALVYEYYYEGERLQAIGYDVYSKTPPVALGERRLINVDPSDPYFIFEVKEEQKNAGNIFSVIFPGIFVIVGLVLIWFALTHQLAPIGNGSEETRSRITDSYVEEKFGLGEGEWSIAEYTVTDMTEESDGSWLITLSDGSVRTDPEGSFQSTHEVGFRFYELTDSSGTPVATFNTEIWEYAGSTECVSYE